MQWGAEVIICARFHLKESNEASTSFANAQLVQKCNIEGGLTMAVWIWIKLGVQGLLGCGNMCAKFHSIWRLLACTSFTKVSAEHKLCEFGEEYWLGQ